MRVTTAPQVSHGPPPAHTHACTARTPHTSRPLGWTSGHRGGSTALATVLRAHELWFRLLAKSQPYRTVGLSLCLSRPPHPALIIHKFSQKNSANPTKRWGGDVAPSCARRCVGSRLPDHARCSFFVRSRHRAHVLPRRAIRLSAGDLGHAHQNSHICLWLRTTSAGWRSEGKSWTRPTSTEHPPCNVR